MSQYRNMCYLRKHQCETKKKISVVSESRCLTSPASCAPGNATHGCPAAPPSCPVGQRQERGTCLPAAPPSCPVGQRQERGTCLPCLCSGQGSLGPQCEARTGQCSCRCDTWLSLLPPDSLLAPGHSGRAGGATGAGRAPGAAGGWQRGGLTLRVREPRAIMADSSAVLEVKVEGFLGRVCLTGADCHAQQSECRANLCVCRSGFTQKGPLTCRASPPQLCSFAPCGSGGSCEQHDGTFTCHCHR